MRKLLAVLCLFILCGCSSVTKIEEDDFVHYELIPNSSSTFGIGYEIVESWNGFKLKEIVPDIHANAVFKNDHFTIKNELVNQFGGIFTYFYDDGTKISELYTGMYNSNRDIWPLGVSVFQKGEDVYFTYYDIYDLVINLVEDGKLVEYKRIPLNDNTFEFKGFAYTDYEMYTLYKNENNTKFVCDEREYIFDITDKVILMKDYILYSTYDSNEVIGTYLIDRKTNVATQLKENIDIYDDLSNHNNIIHFRNKMINNTFVFKEKVENSVIYSYATIENNTLNKIELPYMFDEGDFVSLYNENAIFFNKISTKGETYYVVEIKE